MRSSASESQVAAILRSISLCSGEAARRASFRHSSACCRYSETFLTTEPPPLKTTSRLANAKTRGSFRRRSKREAPPKGGRGPEGWWREEIALVSRFRSSHHCAAHSFANLGIKGTLEIYDSSAVFGFEVP